LVLLHSLASSNTLKSNLLKVCLGGAETLVQLVKLVCDLGGLDLNTVGKVLQSLSSGLVGKLSVLGLPRLCLCNTSVIKLAAADYHPPFLIPL
jgi:hypothetical protein